MIRYQPWVMVDIGWKRPTSSWSMTRLAFFNLFTLGKVRKKMTNSATKTVIHSLMISHLDYANGLLAGLPMTKLKPQQTVQNSAARLIVRDRSFSIKEAKFSLHWLSIVQRIRFKILLMVFDCLQGLSPDYLRKSIYLHIPGRSGLRTLCRSLDVAVTVKRVKGEQAREEHFFNRSFTIFAPKEWNTLPPNVRS